MVHLKFLNFVCTGHMKTHFFQVTDNKVNHYRETFQKIL